MPIEVVAPRMRGPISTTAHPGGCALTVERMVAGARRPAHLHTGGKGLVVGASSGYGLASRIAATFGHGYDTVGVFYERPATDRRTASAGWYNSVAFDLAAHGAGSGAWSLNGDAFSAQVLADALDLVRDRLGPLDTFVYSVAAPARTDPVTGVTYRSVLKTVGEPFTTRSIELDTGRLTEVSLESASEDEIRSTVAVMGGADLTRWVEALLAADLLAPGARVVAFSYIGPEVTWPVYRQGTIGHAKAHLEATAAELDRRVSSAVGGGCHVAIMKSIVSQASAVIPAVPLYMSILFRVMKEAGTHEGPLEQACRLFGDHVAPGRTPLLDGEGRIRLDDYEMRPEIQAEVAARWEVIDEGSLHDLSDFAGYQRYLRQLFGFDVPGIDYEAPVQTDLPLVGVIDDLPPEAIESAAEARS